MSVLRLTAFVSLAFVPFLLPGKGFSQLALPPQSATAFQAAQTGDQAIAQSMIAPITIAQSTTTAQSTTGQSTGTSQPANVSTPGTNLQTPGTNLQTPGAGLQTPGTNLQTPGVGLPTPGTNLQPPGSGTQTPGVGGQSPGVGGQSPGVGGQTTGVGAQTPGVGGQSSGVSSQTSGVGSQTQGVGGQSSGVGGQSLGVGGQSSGVGGQSPGVGGQSSGVGSQPSDTTQTTTGTPAGTGQASDGQAIGPNLPLSTKVPGAEQTFVNGRSTGTRQVAPPISQPASSDATGTQVGPNTTVYPPQLIQGGGSVAPTAQPATTQPAPGTPTNGSVPVQPQSTAPSAGTTSTAASGTGQSLPSQSGQGALDAALQQATCAQNWGQAIRLVNTAIAATPASQTSDRAQLVAYRSRLQTLQAKGVRAPNWSQQCRGGGVANLPGQ